MVGIFCLYLSGSSATVDSVSSFIPVISRISLCIFSVHVAVHTRVLLCSRAARSLTFLKAGRKSSELLNVDKKLRKKINFRIKAELLHAFSLLLFFSVSALVGNKFDMVYKANRIETSYPIPHL